jgi:serine O-acetyltransferase
VTDGTFAMILYRLMQWSGRYRLWPLEMFFNKLNAVLCRCVIGRGAEFGPGFVLVHADGIVINGSVRGGRGVMLEHQVTIGAERRRVARAWRLRLCRCRSPRVLGNVRIGSHAKVGANAVVLSHVPAESHRRRRAGARVPDTSQGERDRPREAAANSP